MTNVRYEDGSSGTQLSAILDRLSTNMLREAPEIATGLAVSEEQLAGAVAQWLFRELGSL
jgi:hypothetical protein